MDRRPDSRSAPNDDVLCALPEEMPVVEAIELHERLRKGSGVAVDLCLLNRAVDEPVTASHRRLMSAMTESEHAEAVAQRLGGSPRPLEAGIDLQAHLYDTTTRYLRQLRTKLSMPVIPVPFIVDRTGLTTTRAVADALSGRLGVSAGEAPTSPSAAAAPGASRPGLAAASASLDVVICCGSGGVGKTTVSAALGMAIAAAEDKRVLVLTVDPARRLCHRAGHQGHRR